MIIKRRYSIINYTIKVPKIHTRREGKGNISAYPMKREDFSYPIEGARIPQFQRRRGSAKLLVLGNARQHKRIEHVSFDHLPDYLDPGDVVVFNNSKVIPTRFWGILESGGQREITLLQRFGQDTWSALIRPSAGVKARSRILTCQKKVEAEVISKVSPELYRIKFLISQNKITKYLYKNAQVNLPFYLRFSLRNRKQYQTVYARYPGSCQPPTAGFHFSRSLMARIIRKGVKIRYVTLHISGSLLSLIANDVERVNVGKEWYTIPKGTAEAICKAKAKGKKIVAIGTTVVRALESAVDRRGNVSPQSGWTSLTIVPEFKFRIVNAFLTNFHLPGSSHLLLTCAFGSADRVLHGYRQAITKNYGFLDFGDAMLIIKKTGCHAQI